MKTVTVSVLAQIHLDEDEIAAAMEGDGETRSEEAAIHALCLESFHPAVLVDVKELSIHPVSSSRS